MRHGLKLLGLAMLAALSLMAVNATAAQASGEWRISIPLKTFKEVGVASKTFVGTVNAGHILVEGLNISCTGGTLSGTLFAGGTAAGAGTFTGCVVVGSKTCKVFSGLTKDKDVTTLTGEGTIKASGEGELLLMEGKHFFLVKGLGEKRVFSLFDVWGKLCPLSTPTEALHVEVTGSTVVYLPDLLTDLVNHEFQTLTLETLKTLFPADKLFLGGEAHFGEGTGPGGVVTGSVHLTSNENWGGE